MYTYQDDLRFADSSSGQGNGGGARTHDRRLPSDLRRAFYSPCHQQLGPSWGWLSATGEERKGRVLQSVAFILMHEKCQFQADSQPMTLGVCPEFVQLKQLLKFKFCLHCFGTRLSSSESSSIL
ncbi:hypothetical protein PoB_005733400 [Plakobranchus ocellatus]|uniref:Uncharacterized protein n=1 Tax=Plakobranchus ocellatus TaxID=259542 RepID=A0AAV4CDW4_9GAST|nr:hypothetical protein PoB_005733400 [Plakobranchus ocellatus]